MPITPSLCKLTLLYGDTVVMPQSVLRPTISDDARSITLTIRNDGDATLTGICLYVDGPRLAISGPNTNVVYSYHGDNPNVATFTVTLNATASWDTYGSVIITSSDADSPFVVYFGPIMLDNPKCDEHYYNISKKAIARQWKATSGTIDASGRAVKFSPFSKLSLCNWGIFGFDPATKTADVHINNGKTNVYLAVPLKSY